MQCVNSLFYCESMNYKQYDDKDADGDDDADDDDDDDNNDYDGNDCQ